MHAISTGAGFAALGFWLFIAAAVIAGVWDSIRKRDAQHETLRRIVESGQPIDAEFTDKLLQVTGGSRDLARDLWVSGLITLSVAPGLGVFGWVMSAFVEPLLLPIMLARSEALWPLAKTRRDQCLVEASVHLRSVAA